MQLNSERIGKAAVNEPKVSISVRSCVCASGPCKTAAEKAIFLPDHHLA